jgi:8-oxo-dGTP pyrophosphatase MutT (NUDIX family)/GNAT superfamily N-acetyltransferase
MSEPWLPKALETDRLRLRAVTAEDVPLIGRLSTDAEVRRYLGGPRAIDQAHELAIRRLGRHDVFTVMVQATETPIGIVALAPYARTGETEVSYQLLPEHWGCGYGREAVSAVLEWGFGNEHAATLPRIIAVTQEANQRSRRLLESLGMILVDRFVEFDAPQAMYALHRPVRDYTQRLRRHVGHDTLLAVAAGVIVLDDAGRVLLQRRGDDGSWGIPGGGLEPGESLEQAAARELMEETGLVAGSLTALDTYSGPEFFIRHATGNQAYVVGVTFLARDVTGDLRPDGEESLELRFFRRDAWPDGLNFYNRRLLDRCLDRI